jgi:hypothetical protein
VGVTKPRKHIGILPGLPFSARRWLLGARVYYTEDGELRNSGIVRLQHLIIKARSDEEWQRYLDELQREWGPTVAAKRAIWKARKAAARQAAKEARQRAKQARREAAEASRSQPAVSSAAGQRACCRKILIRRRSTR